jgi:folate-binding protein YgfZ
MTTADLAPGIRALQGGAAMTRLDDRAVLAVRGEDRASFLQGMLSNDVASLGPGRGAYALLLTEQGRVVGDLRVLALADELVLDVARDRAGAVRRALERFVVADDVEVEDRPEVAVALRGPRAGEVVSRVFGIDGGALPECGHAAAEGGTSRRIARIRDVGVDGFFLWLATADAAGAVAAILAAGGCEAPREAVEVLRVQGGWAREGVDFDERTLAPEVPSLARSISFRKGCYLGQEVVERVAARGHVNWLVMRLEGEGSSAPPRGATVEHQGADVGRVTSSAVDDGRIAALARIRREASAVGTPVTVTLADGDVALRVAETPAALPSP